MWGLGVALAAVGTTGVAQESNPQEDHSNQEQSGSFAPGVRIDWQARAVEVDARVALRAGPLELLACSPQTREHESVLVVLARPMHIHQALGLIGLEPGHPARYDEKTETAAAPTGQRLALSVRFGEGANVRTRPAHELMRLMGRDESPATLQWVFAGSRTFPTGRFGADVDGTVACVVDFDTAVIALNTLHSADNEQLWLEANTSVIPPIGTPATLVITAFHDDSCLVATLDRESRLRFEGRAVSPAELAKHLRARTPEGLPRHLILQADPGVTSDAMAAVVKELVGHGIANDRIEVHLEQRKARDGGAGSGDG